MRRWQVTLPLLFLCVVLFCPDESEAQGSIDPIVAEHIKGLHSPNPRERRNSALALGNMAAGGKFEREQVKPAVPALIRALKDKDEDVREFAAFALGNIRADPAISVPALIEGLKDQYYSVRERSASVLRAFGPEAQPAVPALLKALTDQNSSVREEAAKAVGEIAPAQIAVPALANAFKSFSAGNYAFAEALVKYGRDALSAVPILIEILRQADDNRRSNAAVVLGAIGPEANAAIPALVDALEYPHGDVAASAAVALGRIGQKQAVPALVEALKDSDRFVAARAAEALGRMGENQKEAAAVAARVVAEDLGERPWFNRAAAAEALAELGLHAEAALPALSKVLGPINEADSSERAADAILRIAAALRDARRTSAIPVLKSCEAAMEHSQSGYVRTKALDLSETIAALEAMRRNSPRDLFVGAVQEHPGIAAAIGIYASAAGLWIGLLGLWPMAIFRVGQSVRGLPKVKLPGWLGGIEISFAHLILVGFFQNRDRVLDAWVAKNASKARARFEEIDAVRECGSSPSRPVILNGVTTETLLPTDLQSAFARQKTCVLIHGDRGTGKTTLACEIARWGITEDRSRRLCKYLMIPTFLQENFVHATDGDTSSLIEAVSEKLEILDIEPPPEEAILQLLRRKRLLVILDGLSELDAETRGCIRPASLDFPAHALMVTSRNEEPMGGIRRTMIKTCAAPAAEARAHAEAAGND